VGLQDEPVTGWVEARRLPSGSPRPMESAPRSRAGN
jgi:hypothetical protein